jgi:hypothetical protein
MLQAIGNLTLSQLGYAETIKPARAAPLLDNPCRIDIFDGLELKLSDGTLLRLGSTVYHQHGIIGRGTCVVQAKCLRTGEPDETWNGPLVVKLSWPAQSRISENDMVKKARDAAEHNNHRWVLKHLPKILHAEDQHINSLSRALIDRLGNQYEERVLRILVQEELHPITVQKTDVDLSRSFHEIFRCRHSYSVP